MERVASSERLVPALRRVQPRLKIGTALRVPEGIPSLVYGSVTSLRFLLENQKGEAAASPFVMHANRLCHAIDGYALQHHRCLRLVLRAAWQARDLFRHLLALDHLAEDGVL